MVTPEQATAPWQAKGYAREWAAVDGLSALLELPWRLTTALVGLDRAPRVIVDLGSGPGTYLAEMLSRYPSARGIWLDASAEMRDEAQARLAEYGERVTYILGDIAGLGDVGLPADVDVITNSRVAHHFDLAGLTRFYRAGFAALAPGGWMATLDHIRPTDEWNARLRAVLPIFAGRNAGKPTHPHFFPFPTVGDHLDGLTQAVFSQVEMPWRAFYTCLFMGQKV